MNVTRIVVVHLVRHGESLSNTNGTVGGNHATLTEQGEQQALLLGETWIRQEQHFDLAWFSPLLRAERTASILLKTLRNQALASQAQPDARLIERQHADWEGRASAEVYTTEEKRRMKELGMDYATPGGETFRQVAERTMAWLQAAVEQGLCLKQPRVDILAVSHGHAIRCLLWQVFGLPAPFLHQIILDNTSVSTLIWTEGHGWSLGTLNQTSHLLP